MQSSEALSERYGCSPTTIIGRLRRCGVPIRPSGFQGARIPEPDLRHLYLEEHLPIAQIAAYFSVTTSTIGNRRRRYNIPIRPHHLPQPSNDSGEV